MTTPPQTNEINRVCVVRFGGMGDILLATPAVRALSEHFGAPEIDFIVGKGMRDALSGIPYLRHVTEFDKDGDDARLRNFLRFLIGLRRERYDLFVNFHPSAKTVLMAAASGARRVVTFRKDRRVQAQSGRVRHAVDDFAKETLPLGVPPITDRQMDFYIPDAAHARVADLLTGENIGADDRLLVVNPAATRDINRWPPDRFAGLLDTLAVQMPDVRVVLTGGKNDKKLVEAVLRNLRGASVSNFAGVVNVKELGALLARADTVVTGDTGPLHIASAVGAPLVCLSGAADPDRTGPLGKRDLVVINRELSCVPCQARTCKRGDIACMTQMPVDWVLTAVKTRLAASGRRTNNKRLAGDEAATAGTGGARK